MQLILAIDSDPRRSEQLASLVQSRLQVDLVQATSAGEGLHALRDRVPDLILTSPLLSPFDDGVLDEYLRDLGAAATHVQTVRIPMLSSGPRKKSAARRLFSLGRAKAKTSSAAPDGCDPKIFADEIAYYLTRSLEGRSSAAQATEDRSALARSADDASANASLTGTPITPHHETTSVNTAFEYHASARGVWNAADAFVQEFRQTQTNPAVRVPDETHVPGSIFDLRSAPPKPRDDGETPMAQAAEPQVVADPEPLYEGTPDPIVEPEPVIYATAEPQPFDVAPPSVAFAEPESFHVAQEEPLFVEPERVNPTYRTPLSFEAEPARFLEPEPATLVEPELATTFVEPEPMTFVAPEPVTFVEPVYAPFVEPEPATFVEPEPPRAPVLSAPKPASTAGSAHSASFEAALAAIRAAWVKPEQRTSAPVAAATPVTPARPLAGSSEVDLTNEIDALEDIGGDEGSMPVGDGATDTLHVPNARLNVEKPKKRPEKPRGRKTSGSNDRDDWSVLDPNQYEFSALVNKLDEVTDSDEVPAPATNRR
jgi:hypothetical protein